MHKNFGEWYRLVVIEPDGAKLPKRWAGVKEWATELRNNDDRVLETVRIFHGLPSKVSRDPFLAAFRKQDAAFPQRNDLELQVLAGASLVECVQSVGANGEGLHAAILAGVALDASSLRRSEPRLDELSREVALGLQAIAVKQRQRKPFDPSALGDKANAAAEALKPLVAASDFGPFRDAVKLGFQALLDAVRAAGEELDDAAHNLRRGDEETDILWWVEGGCSRDTNQPWSALKDGAAIIAGTELADLTDVALGPRNATALLERVLSASMSEAKKAPLDEYVNALPKEWTQEHGTKADHRTLDLAPLTFAISLRSKSDMSSWQEYFSSSTGMKASTQLTASRIAHQAYVEAILLRTLANADKGE